MIDPSIHEESAMDGIISFSINSFNEICAIHKPGGISLPIQTITGAGFLAQKKIELLHSKLEQSLMELEKDMVIEKEYRLQQQRLYRQQQQKQQQQQQQQDEGQSMEIDDNNNNNQNDDMNGIDKNDPILQWSNLHFPVALKNSK